MPKMPEGEIKICNILVYETQRKEFQSYFALLEDFSLDLIPIKPEFENDKKNLTFMIVLPKVLLKSKIETVEGVVYLDIFKKFIVPFMILTIAAMVVVSYFLHKISHHITKPIIELFKEIKEIIKNN